MRRRVTKTSWISRISGKAAATRRRWTSSSRSRSSEAGRSMVAGSLSMWVWVEGLGVVDEIVAQVLLGLGLVAGGIAGGRGIEQCVDGLVGKPPTDAEDDAGDSDGGNGVGVLEPRQGEAFAGEGGCEADHDRERGPHVGGEVDGIGEQSVRAVQAGNAAESARAGEIDDDGNQQHGERP